MAYGVEGEFEPADISVRVVGMQEYAGIVSSDALEDGILYSISGLTSLNAFGQPVSNVGEPVLSNDAVTKHYAEENFSKCIVRNWYDEEDEEPGT